MTLKNLLPIFVDYLTDGISTTLAVDLKKTPVTVAPVYQSGTLVNAESKDLQGATAAFITPGPYTASLTGTVVTMTFAVPPPAGIGLAEFFLLF